MLRIKHILGCFLIPPDSAACLSICFSNSASPCFPDSSWSSSLHFSTFAFSQFPVTPVGILCSQTDTMLWSLLPLGLRGAYFWCSGETSLWLSASIFFPTLGPVSKADLTGRWLSAAPLWSRWALSIRADKTAVQGAGSQAHGSREAVTASARAHTRARLPRCHWVLLQRTRIKLCSRQKSFRKNHHFGQLLLL